MRFQTEPLQDEWLQNPLEQIVVAHQIAVQHGKATGRKLSMIVDYNLHASIVHYYKRVDNFWSKIGFLTDENGNLKYPQLYALSQGYCPLAMEMLILNEDFRLISSFCKCVMKEKSIVSLRLFKDKLIRASGVLNFSCTIELINSVKNAQAQYFEDMELQKLTVEQKKKQKMLRVESQEVYESIEKTCRS